MKQVISSLRKIMVVFLVGFMFLLGQAFSFVNVAQADVTTPEGIYYKGTPEGQNSGIQNDNQVRNAQSKLKGAADNIRGKLNLDEDTPRATKEFLNDAKNRVGDTISGNQSSQGSREGYYKNPQSRQTRDRV
ncbi:hypothetical protein H6G76_04910 [Nostoc sp. FACHB-152]|uniref:hypothetical protein n=1 Tax=unclassified Nostoc TaxID=2593658 RepID=UPI001683E884|nr:MULTISPECIES: hypothetical protein [unclassified Nostoc]MBD2446509.1 hypothetical protein [Nostoc sp. FACHB-152]MBD2468694.1 hypothetical protein [Nostoc sp. FACHB-145]